MPVIVEVEFGLPALTDAKSRLGKNLNSDPRKFTEVIALGLDEQFRNKRAGDITSALNANEQIFTVQFVSTPPPPRSNVLELGPTSPFPPTPPIWLLTANMPKSRSPSSKPKATRSPTASSLRAGCYTTGLAC